MIDILLLAIIGIVTYCVASEGPWGAALLLFIVLFAGLLAMNFFEPLANGLERFISSSPSWKLRWDSIALVGLFIGFVFVLRFLAEYLAPSFITVPTTLYEVGRWSCAAAAGYVTMAFLLTALHTAPLPREFIGFKPERKNLFGVTAPDRQWLGFTQYVSEKPFRSGAEGRIFDGPRFPAGDHVGIWPSFPIRYASRRETLSAGGIPAAGRKPSGAVKKRRSTQGSRKRGTPANPGF